MATWTDGRELSARYAVREERLAAYARRGDLGMRSLPGGERLFDEDRVAKLFRRREVSAASVSLIVLGRERLASPSHRVAPQSYIAATRAGHAESVLIPAAPRLPRLLAG